MADTKTVLKAAVAQLVELKQEYPSRWNAGLERELARLVQKLGEL